MYVFAAAPCTYNTWLDVLVYMLALVTFSLLGLVDMNIHPSHELGLSVCAHESGPVVQHQTAAAYILVLMISK